MIPTIKIEWEGLTGWIIDTNRDSVGNTWLVVVCEDGSFVDVNTKDANVIKIGSLHTKSTTEEYNTYYFNKKED